MTDITAGEMPPDPVPPIPPAPELAAEVEAAPEVETAPPEAAAPDQAAPDGEFVAPELALPNGSTSQLVLDHMIDSAESGDQSIAQIIAGLGGTVSRNTIESAVRRLHEAGRLLRVSPGTYRLAPERPPGPAKPASPPEPAPVRAVEEMTDAAWMDALEAYSSTPRLGTSWSSARRPPRSTIVFRRRSRCG
jgi:hypothetical protein